MTPSFRPRLSLPFTIVPESGTVRLVGGEDVRYTLASPNIGTWLPPLLADCNGRYTIDELLGRVDGNHRAQAAELLQRLRDERAVIDGTALDAHSARSYRAEIAGDGKLANVALEIANGEGNRLPVLCQDRLDYGEALAFHRDRRAAGEAWLWATVGPVQRGYVSPAFLPHAGPCFSCLLRHFRRLSPAPEFYDLLQSQNHQELPGPQEALVPEALGILAQLVAWKVRLLGRDQPPSALYRLHVLELATMEVSSHRVLIDPACPECQRGRVG